MRPRLPFRSPQPDAGPVIVQELHPGLFEYRHNPAQRIGARAHRAVEAFHPLHRSERHLRFPGKLVLRPPEKGARRAYMPAVNNDQRMTLPCLSP